MEAWHARLFSLILSSGLQQRDILFFHPSFLTPQYKTSKAPGQRRHAESTELGFPAYPLGDDESPAYSQLSMESDTDEPRSATSHSDRREEEEEEEQQQQRQRRGAASGHEPAFPPYLSCRGCGLLRDEPLGPAVDLVGPYCLRCCKAGREAKGPDYGGPFGGLRGGGGGETRAREDGGDGAAHSADAGPAAGGGGDANDDGGPSKVSACHLCGFSSRYANHVKRHMKTHNGEKPYNCPLCTYASAQLVNLQRHLRIHTGEKPYKCDSCTFACSSLGNLKRHRRMHVPATGSAAQEAPRQVGGGGGGGHNSLKRPWIGQRAKEEEPSMSVEEDMRSDLHIHGGVQNHAYLSAFDGLRAAPPLPLPLPLPLPPPPPRQPATLLEVSADGRGHNSVKRSRIGHRVREDGPSASAQEAVRPDLNLHGGGVHKDDYLSAFDSLRGGVPPPPPHHHRPPPLLDGAGTTRGPAAAGAGAGPRDGRNAPPPPPPPPPLLFPYTCRLCGAVLEDEDGSSAQICAKCTLDMLTKDASSSSPGSPGGERGDRVYTCPICPFLTHYPNHLARHMKTHSGEKPYKCPQCDYASAHFDNLKRHHRVHTGEKPYKCHLCDYACGNLANLKRHQRVHSGVKPFQCPLCSYNCNQSMNLKRHMLRHTGEKPYKCQECGYTTGHWDNYKRHQKKHGLATDGWVKARTPGRDDEEDEEEEEGDEGMGAGAPAERKEAAVDMQYMLGRGGGVVPHT